MNMNLLNFKRLASLGVLVIALVSINIVSMKSANAETDNLYKIHLTDWAQTLERFVDEQGRTDFIALERDTSQLQKFVEAVGKVSPKTHPEFFPSEAHIIAYHINTYNALAMKGIIERGIPKHLNSLWKRASFFKFRSIVIGGQKTNLYDYENKVIRPIGEARVHFALNCMVVDCPRLPTEVFTPETLEQDLQAVSVEFFNKTKHIEIDHSNKRVSLSGIMKFYTKDYVESGKKQDLVAYVNQFRSDKVPSDYRVKYLDYDWTINQAPVAN